MATDQEKIQAAGALMFSGCFIMLLPFIVIIVGLCLLMMYGLASS